MNDRDEQSEARDRLRLRIEGIVGAGPIARFDEALTHPSFANETPAPNNQRLEFLGDAVLGLCVSELLAMEHPVANEGQLTRMRSSLVNGESLAAWGRAVGIGQALYFGRGARLGPEREQLNVLADAVEALIAAVYVARGLEGARALVKEIVGDRLFAVDVLDSLDPKSELQEIAQARGRGAPAYRVVATRGSRHEPTFEVECVVGEEVAGRGEGRSKRLAERAAATAALRHFEEGAGG